MPETRIHIRVYEDDERGLDPADWDFDDDVTAQQIVAYLQRDSASIGDAVREHELIQWPRIEVVVSRLGQKPDVAEWKL